MLSWTILQGKFSLKENVIEYVFLNLSLTSPMTSSG